MNVVIILSALKLLGNVMPSCKFGMQWLYYYLFEYFTSCKLACDCGRVALYVWNSVADPVPTLGSPVLIFLSVDLSPFLNVYCLNPLM